MAPERLEPSHVLYRTMHGQRVLVKVYPAQKSCDEPRYFSWRHSMSVDETALSEPMSDATRRSLSKPAPAVYVKEAS